MTTVKITNISGQNGVKKGYQPRTNFVKEENDLLADSHNILKRCNYLSAISKFFTDYSNEEGSILQYSHSTCYEHSTSYTN
jgi:hypothetical protein